jgi:spore germination protein YaaH
MRTAAVTRAAAIVVIASLAVGVAGCTSIPRGRAQVITRAVAAPPNSAPPSHPVVTAFQPSWNDPGNITDSRAAISMVAISGIDIAADGRSVTTPTADVLKQLTRAHSLGLKGEVLLLNYQAGVGFSDQVAASMLGTAEAREAAATSLADVVKSNRFDGVMFDLESLSRHDAPALTEFAATLRAKVGPDIHLDAAIQPALTPAGYAALGYDIPGLLRSLNNVTVMAYDEHGTFNAADPGPVGSLPWTRRVLDAILHLAQPGQVDLGVPGYGYRWASDGVHTVGDIRARRLVAEARATATFDEREGEWTVTLSDGQVFWWQDARSITLREQLAASLGLHGVAVWSLALSDPIPAVPSR